MAGRRIPRLARRLGRGGRRAWGYCLRHGWRRLHAGPPGGLFWKVFFACWSTAVGTGLGMGSLARLFPEFIRLPVPPGGVPSLGVPVMTGLVMALLLSALLAWSLSRPIRLLREAFGAAARGQLSIRVSPRLRWQHDEFADLGRDYDRMAHQLASLLGAQRRLLHDVSHELRSPLARLQAAVGLLRRSPEGLPQALARIEREVERLDGLVDEVLTLARLESGAPLGPTEPVDVLALLASVADDARFEALNQGKQLLLNGQVPAEPEQGLLMQARGEVLARALDNVLRNAVKFTPPASVVEVSSRLEGAERPGEPLWLHIEVADRGPGLPEAELQRIFEPFVRGSAQATFVRGSAQATFVRGSQAHQPHQPHGFGLGLAITRRALHSHGGDIQAQARAGGGLCMRLRLPLPRDLNRL